MVAGQPIEPNGEPSGEGGMGGVLSNPKHVPSDAVLVRRAVRERWPINLERRQRLITVLCQIAETDVFEVEKVETEEGANGEGSGKSTSAGKITMPNHRNQIAAAKVLAQMVGQNQADEHHDDKMHNDDKRLENETLGAMTAAWARLPDEEKVRMAIAAGKVSKLPPRLQEMAKRMEAKP